MIPEKGYVTNKTDCDDTNPLLHDFSVWYLDRDGDGKGYNPKKLKQTNALRNTPDKNKHPAQTATQITGCTVGQTSLTYVLNADDFDDRDPAIDHQLPQYFYLDRDGDNYGIATTHKFQSNQPPGYAPRSGDCDDGDPLLHPETTWYLDSDKDGWGSDTFIKQCEQPPGHVSNTLDWNDTTEKITNIKPQKFYQDLDQDTYGNPAVFLLYSMQPDGHVPNALDCNDNDPQINPDTVWFLDSDGDGWGGDKITRQCSPPAGHVSNTLDHDDSTVHIDNRPPRTYYLDKDGDSYGNPNQSVYYSYQPDGYVINNLDCNDEDKYISPQTLWFLDLDGDGLGNPDKSTQSCLQPDKHVDNNGDLSDQSKYITNIATSTFYKDADGDGYGNPNEEDYFSFAPPDFSIFNTDCDDTNLLIHPQTRWYLDGDGDGFGDKKVEFVGCVPPNQYILKAGDLDDDDPYITDIPGRYFFRDADRDSYGDPNNKIFRSYIIPGYVTNDQDCNDRNPALHPKTQWYEDSDGDGFGGAAGFVGCQPPRRMVLFQNDFDDRTPNITNIPPRYFFRDADQDGFGTPDDVLFYSIKPDGYVDQNGDCNDRDPKINPNTVWYRDKDKDGFGDSNDIIRRCQKPDDYTQNAQDIDDLNPNITNVAPQSFYRDQDRDGYGDPDKKIYSSKIPKGHVVPGGDCNDNDPLLHPETLWFFDFDQDGFGGKQTTKSCLQPPGHVSNQDDIDDSQKYITDIQPVNFYRDYDEDGYGDPHHKVFYSLKPDGYVPNLLDCDDTNVGIHPKTRWYQDADGDGAGNPLVYVVQCEKPDGFVSIGTDCDDYNSTRLGGLVGAIQSGTITAQEGTDYSDCAVPEVDEHLDRESVEEFTGKAFADLDQDGMGDPEAPVDLNANPEPNFAWVLNDTDACPKIHGPKKFKGCPKPVIVKTTANPAANQVLRLFVQQNTAKKPQTTGNTLDNEILYGAASYPNPSPDGIVRVQWEAPVDQFVNTVVVMGYNKGVLYQSPFDPEDPKTIKIDLSHEPDGLYFIKFLFADGRAMTRKIIIRR